MSTLDAAFIKAYGRSEIAGDAVEGSRPKSATGEPIADELPKQDMAPSLRELYESRPNTRDRIQVHRLTNRQRQQPEPPADTATSEDGTAEHRPRLAVHTVVDNDAAVAETARADRPIRRGGSDPRTARHQTPGDLPGPQFIALDEISRALKKKAAVRSAAQPASAEGAAEPEADSGQPWTIPVMPRTGPQAAFRVGQFAWPEICRTLTEDHEDRFEPLADELISAAQQGRKLLGIASCRPKSGTTTFVLSCALRLATSGLRIAMLDADLAHPELATAVAVLPQFCWHDVITQDLPIGECWIEASSDRVTLVPLAKPLARVEAHLSDRVAELATTIRDAFDFTVVDLGSIDEAAKMGTLASIPLDALVLVQDSRYTADATVEEIRRQLIESGTRCWGVVQNFV